MSGERDVTPRQRRHEATALRIERSAVALVLERGFDNVTVDMICEAAGISQRTFFNYFKTKDAAIIGAPPRKLDEALVREFLASDGPLVRDLLVLGMSFAPVDPSSGELAAARFGIITSTPSLMQKEMERLFAVRDELEDVLVLRLRRTAPAGESPEQTRDEASLLTHIVAALLRYSVERGGGPMAGPPDLDALARTLTAVLPKLAD